METYWIVSLFITSQIFTTRTHRRDHTGIIIIQGCSRKCINYGVYPVNTARREQFRSEEILNKIVSQTIILLLET
ncbi:hypothetical protein Hanom_Chr11g01033351 [Helianthus anomalus]